MSSFNRAFNNEFDHSPDDILDYGFDWSRWLEPDEEIVGSSWSATDGITISHPYLQDGKTSVIVAGGVVGRLYQIINTITTLNTVTGVSRTDSKSLVLSCKRL